ncbi:hypothetical protein N7467_000739 [Penicillium canescens]|nr:hypothetical protein N7467_000739 [Penicillium canescens]
MAPNLFLCARTIFCPVYHAHTLFVAIRSNVTRYQKERGRTKQFDSFFETARSICESSTHADRDSLLADIYFRLGAIAMDASDFHSSRIYKERSFDLVYKICTELGTADERIYLAYAERGEMINEALDIWSVDPGAHKNKIACTTFLKGKLLESMGKTQESSISIRVAGRLREEITKDDRDVESLTMEDFHGIVAFWAR